MENLRNVIRIKNVPSNFIEEAIIILKSNSKINKHDLNKVYDGNNNADFDFVENEAKIVLFDELNDRKNVVILSSKYKRLKFFCVLLICGLIFSLIF